MNFVKIRIAFKQHFKVRNISYILFFAFQVFICNSGCGDKVRLPSVSELSEFENAGAVSPTIDFTRLYETKIDSSSYRVKPEEVLEITMPSILRVVTTEEPVYTNQDDKYICRINKNGNITLPVLGEVKAADKSLAQIETDIIRAYYPKYISSYPSVFVRILEYKIFKVSISGAVETPGLYSLRSDQMSLVSLLMEAGGIIDEGAALIQIIHSENITQLNDVQKPEVPAKQEDKQLYEPIITEISNSTTTNPSIYDIEVQLKFRQFSAQSMKGILTITYDDEVLLTEEMDISQEIERLVLLKQFSLMEPRISTIEVEQKLCELAELLKPGFSSSKQNSIAYNRILREVEDNRKNNLILYRKATEQRTGVFTQAQQQRFIQRETSERNESLLYNSTKEYSGKSRLTDSVLNPIQYKINPGLYNQEDQRIYGSFNLAQNQGNYTETLPDENKSSESIVLPVKGFNIPFADVTLQDGDKVIVERLVEPLFSVVGLVNRPGNFPYPKDVKYNLMQALAFAGGLDQIAEPRYATIYRLKEDGTICNVSYKIINNNNHSQLTEALNTTINPGDIVSVEHTPRTRKNVLLDRVLRFSIGTYFNLNDVWNNN
ncbi:MAG: SLBB domain-containing protein [Sedimentisphaerales bacterium]|nr:SLBB domain-containing protein [Sedimentisphaerales bacterium]